jgi:hypothetical protein
MTVQELIELLEKCPKTMNVTVKSYIGDSDMWKPVDVKYVTHLKNDNKILID